MTMIMGCISYYLNLGKSYQDALVSYNNRLEEILNETVNSISGGEKLKMSLVRTFLKNPDMIILDEPISALDVNNCICQVKNPPFSI